MASEPFGGLERIQQVAIESMRGGPKPGVEGLVYLQGFLVAMLGFTVSKVS